MAFNQYFVNNEVPQKLTLRIFSLANTPVLNSQSVFLNGLLQIVGATNDYTISGTTITFNFDVDASSVVVVNYMVEPVGGGTLAAVATEGRKGLIHWCLRRLGAPVLDINLDDEQIEDRINEALLYFRDYHFDGVERCYLHHQVTGSTVTLTTPLTTELKPGYILTGNSSGAKATLYDKSIDNLKLRYFINSDSSSNFVPGEELVIEDLNLTVNILNSPTAVFIGDIDNQYISVGTKVISVTNIIPQQSSTIGGNLGGMFDFQYQFALNNMFNLASTDLVTYDIYKRYISLWEFMFRGQKGIRFNKKTDRVQLDIPRDMIDRWYIFETWSSLDPDQYQEVYTDEFVREYAYSLLKMQWGANLKKYSGISLPGGVTLNGQQIYDEAVEELRILRDRVRREFEFPPDFMVG